MANELLTVGLVAAAVAAGLVAGVFLTFSDFIMRALRDVPEATGARAMQQINRAVFGSVFLALFLGLAPVSAAMLLAVLLNWSGAAAAWAAAGAGLYLAGVFAVTIFGNVPMNERLDGLGAAAAQGYWQRYLVLWTRLNHLRSAASAAVAVAFLMAALSV